MSSDPIAGIVCSLLFVVFFMAWVAVAQWINDWRAFRRQRRAFDPARAKEFYGATDCYTVEERKDHGYYR